MCMYEPKGGGKISLLSGTGAIYLKRPYVEGETSPNEAVVKVHQGQTLNYEFLDKIFIVSETNLEIDFT